MYVKIFSGFEVIHSDNLGDILIATVKFGDRMEQNEKD